MDFAKGNFCKMAGYRNRLTHFYLQVSPKEIYQIIKDNLEDFEVFMKHIKRLLK